MDYDTSFTLAPLQVERRFNRRPPGQVFPVQQIHNMRPHQILFADGKALPAGRLNALLLQGQNLPVLRQHRLEEGVDCAMLYPARPRGATMGNEREHLDRTRR